MQAGDQREGRVGRTRGALDEPTVQEQRLEHEQHEAEDRPEGDHGVHPPIGRIGEAVPEIEPDDHVEAAQADEKGREACLAREAPLDRLEESDALGRLLDVPYRGQQHSGDQRDAADPDDDAEDVDHAGEGDVVHFGLPARGPTILT